MSPLIFSMGVSLDGYVAGPGADISWTVPDAELFAFHFEQTEGSSALAGGELGEGVRRLKAGAPGPLAVGGALIAGELMRMGLIDEWHMFIYPVVLGGGTPYFPEPRTRMELRLLETRAFSDSQVLYLRYGR